jgi:membrane protein DedA with SNARE-associated domain
MVCIGATIVFAFVYVLGILFTVLTEDRPPAMAVLGPLALAAIPVGFVACAVWWWGSRRSRSPHQEP